MLNPKVIIAVLKLALPMQAGTKQEYDMISQTSLLIAIVMQATCVYERHISLRIHVTY